MQERYQKGDTAVKPNAITYTSVINTYANSRDERAAENAEAILLEMQQLYEQGDSDAKPNQVSYNSVISAYAKSRNHTAGHHALKHLEHMKKLQAEGQEDCKPTIITYNTVINALAAGKSVGAVEKAYDLLAEAHASADKGDRNVQPNTRTYSALLKSIALSQVPDKARRVVELLKEMKRRSIQPTIFVLDEALHCCSFVPEEIEDQSSAFRVAREILDDIHASRNMKARPITYVYYFHACNNASKGSRERRDAVDFGHQLCHEDGLDRNPQIMKVLSQLKL